MTDVPAQTKPAPKWAELKEQARARIEAFLGPTFDALYASSDFDGFLFSVMRYLCAFVQSPPADPHVQAELLEVCGLRYATILRMPIRPKRASGGSGGSGGGGAGDGSRKADDAPLPRLGGTGAAPSAYKPSTYVREQVLAHADDHLGASVARGFRDGVRRRRRVVSKMVYRIEGLDDLPPFFRRAQQEQVFYEAILNFVVRLAVLCFASEFVSRIVTELNRLFRSDAFNTRPPPPPPLASGSAVLDAQRLHRYNQATDTRFYTMREIFERDLVQSNWATVSMHRRPAARSQGLSLRAAATARSPLIAALLPGNADRRARVAMETRGSASSANVDRLPMASGVQSAGQSTSLMLSSRQPSSRQPVSRQPTSRQATSRQPSSRQLTAISRTRLPFRDSLDHAWYKGLSDERALFIRLAYVNSFATATTTDGGAGASAAGADSNAADALGLSGGAMELPTGESAASTTTGSMAMELAAAIAAAKRRWRAAGEDGAVASGLASSPGAARGDAALDADENEGSIVGSASSDED